MKTLFLLLTLTTNAAFAGDIKEPSIEKPIDVQVGMGQLRCSTTVVDGGYGPSHGTSAILIIDLSHETKAQHKDLQSSQINCTSTYNNLMEAHKQFGRPLKAKLRIDRSIFEYIEPRASIPVCNRSLQEDVTITFSNGLAVSSQQYLTLPSRPIKDANDCKI